MMIRYETWQKLGCLIIHTLSHNWLINVFDKMQPNNSIEKRLKLLPTMDC